MQTRSKTKALNRNYQVNEHVWCGHSSCNYCGPIVENNRDCTCGNPRHEYNCSTCSTPPACPECKGEKTITVANPPFATRIRIDCLLCQPVPVEEGDDSLVERLMSRIGAAAKAEEPGTCCEDCKGAISVRAFDHKSKRTVIIDCIRCRPFHTNDASELKYRSERIQEAGERVQRLIAPFNKKPSDYGTHFTAITLLFLVLLGIGIAELCSRCCE